MVRPKVVLRRGAWVTAAVLLLVTLSLIIDHARTTRLLKPTGAYAVGRTVAFWAAAAQPDRNSAVLGEERGIIAWIWYPARVSDRTLAAPYMPDRWRRAFERRIGFVLGHLAFRDLSAVRANSVEDAPFDTSSVRHPVVILRAGLSALTLQYSTLAEDLASHGYVVVGVDSPFRTLVTVLPDGKVIVRSRENDLDALSGPPQEKRAEELVSAWSADMTRMLDDLARDPPSLLAGRLDLSHVGIVGHSLGGATALRFCRDDRRCAVAIDVDGAPLPDVVTTGVPKPTMFLLGDHGTDPADEVRLIKGRIATIVRRLAPDDRKLMALSGSNHFYFSDAAVIEAPWPVRALRALDPRNLTGPAQLARTRGYIEAFLRSKLTLSGTAASDQHIMDTADRSFPKTK